MELREMYKALEEVTNDFREMSDDEFFALLDATEETPLGAAIEEALI